MKNLIKRMSASTKYESVCKAIVQLDLFEGQSTVSGFKIKMGIINLDIKA